MRTSTIAGLVVIGLAAACGRGGARPARERVEVASRALSDASAGGSERADVADAATPADADAPATATATSTLPCDGRPHALVPGLVRERWPIDATPAIPGEACMELVRADPGQLRPRLVTASRDGLARPAPAWLADLHLVAAINSGMFLDDGRSVGLLVDGDHVDQPRDNPKFGGFLAFGPRVAGAPPVVLAGRDCPGFDLAALRARYRSVIQSYRLLDCDGRPIAWADPKAYSAAVIAVDRAGRLVFVHVRAPFLMRDLARALAGPALGLTGALFVEGGPEATLAVAGPPPLVMVGSYETGFVEDDRNQVAWALPNLVALVRP